MNDSRHMLIVVLYRSIIMSSDIRVVCFALIWSIKLFADGNGNLDLENCTHIHDETQGTIKQAFGRKSSSDVRR